MPFFGSTKGSYGIGRSPYMLNGSKVLILYDIASPDTMTLVKYFNSRYIHTQLVPRNTYNGTNPPLVGYSTVIMLDGNTYTQDLNTNAQVALKQFVSNGGKYISSEWAAYQVKNGRLASMTDLVLLSRNTAKTSTQTYVIDPAYASHPIFNGFTGTISMPLTSYNQGPTSTFGTQPAQRLAWHLEASEETAIAVRTYGTGKIVHFSFAGGSYFNGVMNNPNVMKLIYNAYLW